MSLWLVLPASLSRNPSHYLVPKGRKPSLCLKKSWGSFPAHSCGSMGLPWARQPRGFLLQSPGSCFFSTLGWCECPTAICWKHTPSVPTKVHLLYEVVPDLSHDGQSASCVCPLCRRASLHHVTCTHGALLCFVESAYVLGSCHWFTPWKSYSLPVSYPYLAAFLSLVDQGHSWLFPTSLAHRGWPDGLRLWAKCVLQWDPADGDLGARTVESGCLLLSSLLGETRHQSPWGLTFSPSVWAGPVSSCLTWLYSYGRSTAPVPVSPRWDVPCLPLCPDIPLQTAHLKLTCLNEPCFCSPKDDL